MRNFPGHFFQTSALALGLNQLSCISVNSTDSPDYHKDWPNAEPKVMLP